MPIHVAFAPGEGRTIDHDAAQLKSSSARRRLKLCSMLVTSGAILGALGDLLQRGRLAEYGGIYESGRRWKASSPSGRGGPAEWKIALFQRVAARPLAGNGLTDALHPQRPT